MESESKYATTIKMLTACIKQFYSAITFIGMQYIDKAIN